MLGEMLPEGRYWRFNPRIGVEPIDDPAPAKLAELKGIARAYADTPATASRLDALARALRPRLGAALETLFFPGECHGECAYVDQIEAHGATAGFLARYLLP